MGRTWQRTILRFRGRLRTALRGLVGVSLAAVIALAATLSGRTYLWCIPMGRVMATCCLAALASSDVERRAEPALVAECCEARSMGTVAAGDASPRAPEVPTSLAAAFARFEPVRAATVRATAARPGSATQARAATIRAGPDGPLARCVRLGVLRC